MIKVTVIIPYYQNREGILRRTLASVIAQELPPGIQVDVIVIDDGSPVPVHKEIEELRYPSPHRLIVIEQPNGGVGSARNRGLRNVSEDTKYIAFLDSDDIWHPRHLSQAVSALEQGYDYYFCDCRRIGNKKTFYSERNFSQFLAATGAKKINSNVHAIVDKDAFCQFSLRRRVSMIPTIVYRRSVAPHLMFDKSLHVAGEDCLFLFQLMSRCGNICCSLDELVTCADGINIFASNDSWDSPKHLVRQMGGLLALYKFKEKLRLSPKDDNFLDIRIKKTKQIFAFLTVRHFIKHRVLWSKELSQMIRRDSKFWVWYPMQVLYVSLCFPLRLYDPLDDFWCSEGSGL